MTLRALITRPEEDAAPLAAALIQRGIETSIESLLSIRTLPETEIDLSGVQAMLFTSANGVRAFAELAAAKGLVGWRELPVLAVGDATARTARAAGFTEVESAAGNVESLAELAAAKLDPQKGPLFHAAGSAVAGDLAGLLSGRGFELRRSMIYEARPADSLSPATVAALEGGSFDFMLFFSPRTAATFAALTQAAGDKAVEGCRRAAALCLSPAVANVLGALPFRAMESADHPDLPSMLQLVERMAGTGSAAASAEPEKIIDVTPSAAAPPPQAQPAWAPPAKTRAPWFATVAAAAIAAAIVAAIVSLLLRPEAPTDSAGVNVAVEERLTAAEKTSADLAARLTAAEDASAAVKDEMSKLAGDLASLRTDMTSLATGTGDDGVAVSQLTALTDRLAAAEEKVRTLSAPAADGSIEGDTAVRLSAENIQMKNDLAALREALAQATAANSQLTSRLGELENNVRDSRAAGAQAALVLAVANLTKTMATAEPFAAPLTALKDIVAADSTLAQKVDSAAAPVAALGDRGVPTLAVLLDSFPAVADAVARAAQKTETADSATAGDGFFSKTWRKISNGVSEAVTVRPEGEAVGDGPLERLARAEVRLAELKLADAVAELDGLTGAPRDAAAPWLDQAKARLAADKAIEELQALALGHLASPAANGAGG
ncbi:MAG: uroporphyrinogen-III synthase [Dongiaceae bacterium]